ncbi:exodeoxyribonuclease 7 large subunit [Azospira sp. I13]|uniref:exodeoxyribonuclease VII large subunit n=1 Tax=Azospira sp. I13 TaxID=1765050 RepID=UPI000D471018|nr:exodeoxyribonuclease VII large subunit [Azospira sp. I13]GBG00772.1 exodeoxyribonuclease 7 large subunit [Azospira sp. I13]
MPSLPPSPAYPSRTPDLLSRSSPVAPQQVISVSELNRQARQRLESAFPLCWVAGEISNLTIAASGHAYFSLKDRQAQARCVMFRNRAQLLGFRLENGLQVEARVLVSLYEPRGDFQLNVEALRRAGQGDLYERFLRLKAQLEAEGLFAAERKRPLPAFPRTLGIVTSPQAAALRDVLTTLARRAPQVRVVLYPTLVQGEEAPRQIVAALQAAAARREADVLLVVRGGGSIEDLWAFNDEGVARAIAACPMPVVSGVGHETDFTIADFAADLRAPTPTAAAELAAPDREGLLNHLQRLDNQLSRRIRRRLEAAQQRLDWTARRLKHPAERLALQRQGLEALGQRLQRGLGRHLERAAFTLERAGQRLLRHRPRPAAQQARLEALGLRLAGAQQRLLQSRRARLERLAAGLTHLNPEAVLARGYAIAFDAQGQTVHDAASLSPGQRLTLHLHRGRRQVQVSDAAPDT